MVHGIKRKSSSFNTQRVDHIYVDPHFRTNFFLHYADLTDSNSIFKIISEIRPHEIYNLGAQSHVGVSFENPEYTAQVSGLGTLRILEAIRILKLEKKARFYQASTSELFGKVQGYPQTETTPFYPRSPYGVAKLYGFWWISTEIWYRWKNALELRRILAKQSHERTSQSIQYRKFERHCFGNNWL